MRRGRRWMLGSLLLCGLLLSACAHLPEEEEELNQPATLEAIDGSDVSRITLTEQAVERVDIQAAPVVDTASGTAIPYAAVFYTADDAVIGGGRIGTSQPDGSASSARPAPATATIAAA